jgi:hypothetical protein
MHRQLSMRHPSDAELCRILMSYTRGSTALCQQDFLTLLKDVLGKISRDTTCDTESANLDDEDATTVELQPNGEITVHVFSMGGSSASLHVDDRDLGEVLQRAIEEELKIPVCSQQLVLGSSVLKKDKELYLQGVEDNATITIVRAKPQATILRIRKTNLGDTNLWKNLRNPLEPGIKACDSFPDALETQLGRSHSLPSSKRSAKNPYSATGCVDQLPWKSTLPGLSGKKPRKPLPDVKIRRCKLGRV